MCVVRFMMGLCIWHVACVYTCMLVYASCMVLCLCLWTPIGGNTLGGVLRNFTFEQMCLQEYIGHCSSTSTAYKITSFTRRRLSARARVKAWYAREARGFKGQRSSALQELSRRWLTRRCKFSSATRKLSATKNKIGCLRIHSSDGQALTQVSAQALAPVSRKAWAQARATTRVRQMANARRRATKTTKASWREFQASGAGASILLWRTLVFVKNDRRADTQQA